MAWPATSDEVKDIQPPTRVIVPLDAVMHFGRGPHPTHLAERVIRSQDTAQRLHGLRTLALVSRAWST